MNTYEKKYKEALGWIQSVYPTMTGADKEDAEHFFPELKESEDERVRKELCKAIWTYIPNEEAHEYIKWLEKQGKQNPVKWSEEDEKIKESIKKHIFNANDWYVSKVDGKIHNMLYNPTGKVESKFKVGDFIVNDYCKGRVIEITTDAYLLDTGQGIPFSCEHNVHLWTIADAKEGDVLVNGSNIFIFHFLNDTRLMGYCHVNTDNGRFYDDVGKNECLCLIDAIVNPATKEQRNLLFQKIKEAGYEWDSENNELKTIEQKPIDKTESKFHEGNWITNGDYTWEIVEVKPLDYILQSQDGNIVDDTISYADEHFHLWSIQDAKDGDVLVTPPIEGLEHNEQIFIFKAINSRDYVDDCIEYYGRLCDGVFYKNKTGYMGTTLDTFYPATKEQRELLFQKMGEAEYEWDANKKELKKFEPKFNVDDWIVADDSYRRIICHIDAINNNLIAQGYAVSDENGLIHDISFSEENKWHKWTIADAKDGDVIVCNINKAEIGGDVEKLPNITPTIFMYQNVVKDNDYIHSYCALYDESSLVLQNTMYYNKFVDNIHPATKEQRDLLFSKIEEANYKWDAENKELNKIESKTLDANKVIEWLKTTIKEVAENYGVYKETRLILPYHSVEDLINNFKEFFVL